MDFKIVVLWTDALIYFLLIVAIIFGYWASKKTHLRAAWRQVVRSRLAMVSLVVLTVYTSVGVLDSLHFRPVLPGNGANGEVHYAAQTKSVLDVLLNPLGTQLEKTYSAPFALHLFTKEAIETADGKTVRDYPRLRYGGADLKNKSEQFADIVQRTLMATLFAVGLWLIFLLTLSFWLAHKRQQTFRDFSAALWRNQLATPWRVFFISVLCALLLIVISLSLAQEYHLLGTDKVGQDVFYQTIKSIRTGLVIGTLTTLIMLPFAILLGIAAGYFGGWIDDVIQYVYITLSSIPGVLLIAAAVLSLQIFIANHPELFHTLTERADARLLALCVILGITSWTGLCRLLRAETLKIREVDFIQAALALGVGKLRIIVRHILPNVMHIVLIAVVLDFSTLVLAEAVLSYVGVGVDPTAMSWGNMINSARLELAREPVVWWPLLAAFIFMFTLVLAANLFADAVRDAFDPRIRKR